jgi:membrane protein implicated in regulation of membrane protease activity
VFGEAAKDACFAHAALGSIARAPLSWLARVPRKLGHTFDYGGAPGWYLNASNPAAFGDRAKLVLGSAETIWQRGASLLAIIGLSLLAGPRARARKVLGAVAGLSLFTPMAWPAMLGLVAQGLLLGGTLCAHLPALTAVAAVGTTALSHAVFFGAGRYSMVCYGAVALLAAAAIRRPQAPEGHRGREVFQRDSQEGGKGGKILARRIREHRGRSLFSEDPDSLRGNAGLWLLTNPQNLPAFPPSCSILLIRLPRRRVAWARSAGCHRF